MSYVEGCYCLESTCMQWHPDFETIEEYTGLKEGENA